MEDIQQINKNKQLDSLEEQNDELKGENQQLVNELQNNNKIKDIQENKLRINLGQQVENNMKDTLQENEKRKLFIDDEQSIQKGFTQPMALSPKKVKKTVQQQHLQFQQQYQQQQQIKQQQQQQGDQQQNFQGDKSLEKWLQLDISEMYIIKQESLKKAYDIIVTRLKKEKQYGGQGLKRTWASPVQQQKEQILKQEYNGMVTDFQKARERFGKLFDKEGYKVKKQEVIKKAVQIAKEEIIKNQQNHITDQEIFQYYIFDAQQAKKQQTITRSKQSQIDSQNQSIQNLQGISITQNELSVKENVKEI